MTCLVCGLEVSTEEDFVCSEPCKKVYDRVAPMIVKLFLQEKKAVCLRSISEKPPSEKEMLAEIWDETPLKAIFKKRPNIQDERGPCVAVILRAKRGGEIRQLGTVKVDEMTQDQMLEKFWTDDLSEQGYQPDFKKIY